MDIKKVLITCQGLYSFSKLSRANTVSSWA